MAKESSIAPKERVNILYKSQVGDAQEEVELPLKMLMIGDYTGRPDNEALETRKPINVDKSNFKEVMAKQELAVSFSVADKLSNEKDASIPVNLKLNSLDDFGPESIVNQVPELKKLLELRAALSSLKNPMDNKPMFRRKLQALLKNDSERKKLMAELGLSDEGEKK